MTPNTAEIFRLALGLCVELESFDGLRIPVAGSGT